MRHLRFWSACSLSARRFVEMAGDGIDFALTLVARVVDQRTASPEIVALLNETIAPFRARRVEAVAKAAARLSEAV